MQGSRRKDFRTGIPPKRHRDVPARDKFLYDNLAIEIATQAPANFIQLAPIPYSIAFANTQARVLAIEFHKQWKI